MKLISWVTFHSIALNAEVYKERWKERALKKIKVSIRNIKWRRSRLWSRRGWIGRGRKKKTVIDSRKIFMVFVSISWSKDQSGKRLFQLPDNNRQFLMTRRYYFRTRIIDAVLCFWKSHVGNGKMSSWR